MNRRTFQVSTQESVIHTDVLVLGGGPAGTWAAVTAAAQGARVVLADKGYCGTSGATAPANTGAWYLPKGAQRDAEIERRLSRSTGLADRLWLQNVMEQAQKGLDNLGDSGYPFPVDDAGQPYRANLRGPDYMAFMRRRAIAAGVRILDHHPALELLTADGVIAGAAGIHPRTGNRWEVRAGAVVLATGGCAFLSHALGCDGNTGDGYLMGAEAGVRLSGMEFSSQYGLSPAHTSVTKGLTFSFASFYLEDGSPLPETGEDRAIRIARQLIEGQKVYALMNRGNPVEHDWLRQGQPIPEVIGAVQQETLPLDVNFFRTGDRIALSRQRLDAVWADVRDYLVGEGRNALRAREAAAMTATARWIWASADARKESRGMHRRKDFTTTDVQQTRRILTSGLDHVAVVAEESQWKEVA